ncbi:MAG: hypothetical protein HYZ29_24885 [Myxococcales bacterium]|nr:hypothetical protein [Myxococcales bacterium]
MSRELTLALLVLFHSGPVSAQQPGVGDRERSDVRGGLFLRAGIGGSYLGSPQYEGLKGEPSRTAEGRGLAWEALVGGAVEPGFFLGGGLVGANAESAIRAREGAGDQSLRLAILGAFAQVHLTPRSGAYVQALLGLSTMVGPNQSVLRDSKSFQEGRATVWWGPAAGVGGGYDLALGRRFAIGPELRFIYAPMRWAENLPVDHIKALTLLVTATHR